MTTTIKQDQVLFIREGQFIFVDQRCKSVLAQLKQPIYQVGDDPDHGYQITKVPKRIAEAGRSYGRKMLRFWAGMELPVRLLLARAGIQVQAIGRQLTTLSPPELTQSQDSDAQVLDLVRRHDRSLIRYNPDAVSPATLIRQIAQAWPELHRPDEPNPDRQYSPLTIAVAVTRKANVYRLADDLRRQIPDTIAVTGSHTPAMTGRIAVCTPLCLAVPRDLEKRDIVIAANALEIINQRGQFCLGHATRARLYGLIAENARPSPWERDQLVQLFGFEEARLPRHCHHERTVHVIQQSIHCGKELPSKLSVLELKRQAIWHNGLRNRLVAKIARGIRAGHHDLPSFGAINELMELSHARVVVVVENVEHALALADHLPGWPIFTGEDVNTTGLSGRQRALLRPDPNPFHDTGKTGICTFTALAARSLADDVGVVIRADGGPGMLPVNEQELIVPNDEPLAPLVVIDITDRHHPQLRRWSRDRRQAYTERGWFEPGVNPVQVRVAQFLTCRPTGGKS